MLGVPKKTTSESRARLRDSEFLERVRDSSISELWTMLKFHSGKNAPRWKRVAIRRQIAKIEGRDIAWVMALDEIEKDADRLPYWRFDVYLAARQKFGSSNRE